MLDPLPPDQLAKLLDKQNGRCASCCDELPTIELATVFDGLILCPNCSKEVKSPC